MLVLVLIGILAGLTTVLFGFGGGFVTVPVIVWADGALGAAAPAVAVATANFGDMAGNLEARYFTDAGWRWIETQALHHVGPVHPCCHHVDGHFPGAGCG